MTMSIEVENVHLRYGEHTALDGLTLNLDGGKIYGLLGRNGAGKTSLLSLLAAFRKPTSGQVLIDKQPVFENPRITRQVCLVGATGAFADKSDQIKDTLDVAATLRPNWDRTYAARLMDLFGIPNNKQIGELSLGQQSALGIVIGLASNTAVTIFDESHVGMDVPSRNAFYDELLADFMARPRTIIISTHLVEELARVFEEVVIIERGRLVLHENAEALLSRGATITGPSEQVDRFVAAFKVLGEKRLGGTKSVTIYGALDGAQRTQALAAGIEVEPVTLQDLFVHLTKPAGVTQ